MDERNEGGRKSRSGKTEQVHRIIYAIQKQIGAIYLFSQTAMINKDQFKYIPENNLHTTLDLDFIENLIQFQKETPKKDRKNVVILLDDIIGDQNIKSNVIRDLFTLGRHFKISVIFLSQSYKQTGGMSTIIRENTNYVISFFQHHADRRKSFCKEFCSIKSSKEGEEIYKKITSEPFQSVVINCLNTKVRDYFGYLMKYKVNMDEKIPKFVIENKIKRRRKIKLGNGNKKTPVMELNLL